MVAAFLFGTIRMKERHEERVPMDGGNTIDVGALISSLVYIVPLLALMLSVQTFSNAAKERHAKSAAEAANLKSDLTHLTAQVSELKASMDEAETGYHKNATRLTALEEQVKTLWSKVNELERRIHNYG